MLIEFSVTNFRSIKNTQTLSMVAAKSMKELLNNTFSPNYSKIPLLLNSAGIYGANAAGKSNIIKAIEFMEWFVLKSHKRQEGEEIEHITPFLFNNKTKTEPSEFEVIFIHNDICYQYGFAANNKMVTHEWLFAHAHRIREPLVFERKYDKKNKSYKWPTLKLKGKREIEIIKNATRNNALFLSTAIQFNNEKLKPVFNWFQDKLTTATYFPIKDFTTGKQKQAFINFIKQADTSIDDISMEFKQIAKEDIREDMSEHEKKRWQQLVGKTVLKSVKIFHSDNTNEMIGIDLFEESDGTRCLFEHASDILKILDEGSIWIVDEINDSMHPLLVRFLIGLFHNKKINKHNAQLIFSTHDTTILDKEILRRDQVWFVEKDKENSTQLYPLSDFKVRNDAVLGKNYLQGRYGAIPYFGEFNI